MHGGGRCAGCPGDRAGPGLGRVWGSDALYHSGGQGLSGGEKALPGQRYRRGDHPAKKCAAGQCQAWADHHGRGREGRGPAVFPGGVAAGSGDGARGACVRVYPDGAA